MKKGSSTPFLNKYHINIIMNISIGTCSYYLTFFSPPTLDPQTLKPLTRLLFIRSLFRLSLLAFSVLWVAAAKLPQPIKQKRAQTGRLIRARAGRPKEKDAQDTSSSHPK